MDALYHFAHKKQEGFPAQPTFYRSNVSNMNRCDVPCAPHENLLSTYDPTKGTNWCKLEVFAVVLVRANEVMVNGLWMETWRTES
jgi:hypothetical protein